MLLFIVLIVLRLPRITKLSAEGTVFVLNYPCCYQVNHSSGHHWIIIFQRWHYCLLSIFLMYYIFFAPICSLWHIIKVNESGNEVASFQKSFIVLYWLFILNSWKIHCDSDNRRTGHRRNLVLLLIFALAWS